MAQTEQSEMEKRYHTVSIWLATKSTDKLIIFLKAAFNAKELGRVYTPDGSIGHAEVQIGDSKILMFDLKPGWPAFRSLIHLYVDNADEMYENALNAGAKSMTRLTTHFWGDRGGRVIDPFGNIWWINSHVDDVSAEEMGKRAKQPEFIEAMDYATKKLYFRFYRLILCKFKMKLHGDQSDGEEIKDCFSVSYETCNV